MKKLIAIICLLSALTLAFSGCSGNDAPDGFKSVSSDSDSFKFYVPNAWTSNNSGGTASAYYSTSDYSNMSFTCMVIDPEEMDDLTEYYNISVAEFEKVLPEFELIESTPAEGEETEEPIKIAGLETIIFEYKCKVGDDIYRYKQAVTMKDDFYYIFTYTALESNYDLHLEDVDATIANIKFK